MLYNNYITMYFSPLDLFAFCFKMPALTYLVLMRRDSVLRVACFVLKSSLLQTDFQLRLSTFVETVNGDVWTALTFFFFFILAVTVQFVQDTYTVDEDDNSVNVSLSIAGVLEDPATVRYDIMYYKFAYALFFTFANPLLPIFTFANSLLPGL